MIGFILLHEFVLNKQDIVPVYIRTKDISYVSTQTIGVRILTKIMLNNQQVIYVIESINEIMKEIA